MVRRCRLLKFVNGTKSTFVDKDSLVLFCGDDWMYDSLPDFRPRFMMLQDGLVYNASPPPPLAKEIFLDDDAEKEGEAADCRGEIKTSPPPLFAKENLAADDDEGGGGEAILFEEKSSCPLPLLWKRKTELWTVK
mmetsp:Transcript_1244/g.2785  ORF Transcript_1244/g.2785 Transcript_1244/m.2785 type:complete len:135 (+) Transcript_1244:2448-2852(+)